MVEGSPDELNEEESGMPPEIPLGLNDEVCTVQLVNSEDQASVIIGFQMLLEDQVLSTKKLYEYLNLGRFAAADIGVEYLQLSCHLANDNKQMYILTGQGSCSVMYPMPYCVVHKDNLGRVPVWIQRRYIQALFSAPQ